MNRKLRRKADKLARKKLNEKDYKEFKDGLIAEAATIQAEQRFGTFVENFILAMRKNHISEERIIKIIDDFEAMVKKKGEEN